MNYHEKESLCNLMIVNIVDNIEMLDKRDVFDETYIVDLLNCVSELKYAVSEQKAMHYVCKALESAFYLMRKDEKSVYVNLTIDRLFEIVKEYRDE